MDGFGGVSPAAPAGSNRLYKMLLTCKCHVALLASHDIIPNVNINKYFRKMEVPKLGIILCILLHLVINILANTARHVRTHFC